MILGGRSGGLVWQGAFIETFACACNFASIVSCETLHLNPQLYLFFTVKLINIIFQIFTVKSTGEIDLNFFFLFSNICFFQEFEIFYSYY